MTLDQLSTAIDIWVWIDQQITRFWPGVSLCVLVYIAWAIAGRVRGLLRRANRQVDDALAQPVPAAADNQPGTDQHALDTITAAWNADTRKETP
ncbi:hypothetical protein [Streptomyces pseudogriseolus]|uniref:hypothetical protein n=1 Tax=Streptomyces pseudogriseolus TaxID=36817 RepID=UPI003FA270F7